MDTKSLARSKRAHTQHHSKKPHRVHASKAATDSSGGSGSTKKPSGKQLGDRTSRSQGGSALPSNWDRYDDDLDLGSGDALGDSANQPSDVILPKSKGADYLHLITEAQSQPNMYLDSFPSLDDVLPDFYEGLGSILSIRGEGIQSRVKDDDFIVEERASSGLEASYLSLNLHALAEQLGKVELSKRLFIEADLLPEELSTEGLTASSQGSNQIQATGSIAVTRKFTESALPDFSEEPKINSQHFQPIQSKIPNSGGLKSILSDTGSYEVKEIRKSDLTNPPQLAEINRKVSDLKNNTTIFKAADAEAELDMLLDSFTEFPDSSDSGAGKTVLGQDSSASILPSSRKGVAITANIDDFLNDLLEESSNLVNQNELSHTTQERKFARSTPFPSASLGSGTKSEVLNDFDSWLDTI